MAKKVKYEAIEDFTDLQDKNKTNPKGKKYKKGDSFPSPANKKVEEERINELLSRDNRQGKPVIKEVE